MGADRLAAGLDAVADVLIPPEGDWPAPSSLDVGADLAARLRDVERAALARTLEALEGSGALPGPGLESRLAALEDSDPAGFGLLRQCVYFGYYAQPAVVRLLRRKGYDINEAPQPRGYRMKPFDPERTRTVDPARRMWIPADQAGTTLRTAS